MSREAMENDEQKQRDFHHPYTPYSIQLEFMNVLYDAIQDGCVGILESPTGTGKSLSLICGALTWLRDRKTQDFEEQLRGHTQATQEPDWVTDFVIKDTKQRLSRHKVDLELRLKAVRDKEAKEKALHDARGGDQHYSKKLKKVIEVGIDGDSDDQFLLDDYESDTEGMDANTDDYSPEVKQLMIKLGMVIPGASQEEADLDFPDETKIFFCSRTHSQLTQFVNELRKVEIPPSFPLGEETVGEQIKHLSLGSRKSLCINSHVQKLHSVSAMNERCLEMQKSGTSEQKKCEFLPTKEDIVQTRDFRDHALAGIRDIEDLAKLGKKMGTCPYYSARSAIKPSEIVTLPYPLLLQKSAREALGISLKGNVVIIDEAHNLMDAISSIYSITVTLPQLQICKSQLETYLGKFKNRLKGSNKVYIMQVSRLLDNLARYLEALNSSQKEGEVPPGDLLSSKGMDQINFFKLQRYLSESKLARKIEGYVVHEEEKKSAKLGNQPADNKPKDSVPVLMHLQGFLQALANPSSEGKIFHGQNDSGEACFKYLLLDPAFHFKEIVDEARSVILAGGTMQPMEDYMTRLFPYVSKEKIRTLSCGHVIPKDNLLVWPLVKTQTGRDFEFLHGTRMDPNVMFELGRAVVNLCSVIPKGVVCFFPSYSYLDIVVKEWQKKTSDGRPVIWEKLGKSKEIFRESSEKSSVEETLREYSQAIDSGKGGLLLSVVGGKMSEGINFNDNLGRGVIMIGLPFPNIQSPEWKAKLQHVEKFAYDSYVPPHNLLRAAKTTIEARRKEYARAAKTDFYENTCMRAVNQSIGRAIRHREDYATIVLIDRRYATPRIQNKLPGWIKTGLMTVDPMKADQGRVVDVVKSCSQFFRSKNPLI